MTMPVLQTSNVVELDGLQVRFSRRGEIVHAVRDASLTVPEGGAMGLVGESGSGKSTVARTLVGLHSGGGAMPSARHFAVNGQPLDIVDAAAVAQLRGSVIAMVFQDPLTFLNPLMRIGRQIAESVTLHDPKADVAARTRELLERVRLPERVARSYPHELSGGMRQRALLAIALGCRPRLLLADEPTTALDASTQAEILALLGELRRELGLGLLFISHDLGAVATLCEHVTVMYGGYTMETGPLRQVFDDPVHPYTHGLLAASRASRQPDGRFFTMATPPGGWLAGPATTTGVMP